MDLKSVARGLFHRLGYDVRRVTGELGQNAYLDMRTLLAGRCRPVVVDVGANVGQTINRLREALNAPIIHAFEPSPSTYAELARRTARIPNIHLENCALGSSPGSLDLLENVNSDMSSFLKLGPAGWGEVRARTPVPVRTLDDYCAERGLERLDLLKSDTQGWDLEVLRGARRLLNSHRVRLVFLELNFDALYEGQPRVDEVFAFLYDRDFRLVSLFPYYGAGADHAAWADGLFVCPTTEVSGTHTDRS